MITDKVQEKLAHQNQLIQDNITALNDAQADLAKLKNDSESLQIKIDIGQQQLEFHEINNAESRIKNLQHDIAKSEQSLKALETEIATTQANWQMQYKEAQK